MKQLADAWNRFWFTDRDPFMLCVLRIIAGLLVAIYLLSWSDLVIWFGSDGILSSETVAQLPPELMRWSYLDYFAGPGSLWIVHAAGILVALAFAAGLWTRITSVLTLLVVLSYIHRGPTLTEQVEPILSMLVLYLCLAPCGAMLSIDSWLRSKPRKGRANSTVPGASLAANISLRLIQLHLSGFYLLIGLSKLTGASWWAGEAVWWLMASTESSLIDPRWLGSEGGFYVVNLWTHAIVLFEICFGLLVWHKSARAVLLWVSIVMWLSLLLASGLVLYCVTMMLVGIAFADEDWTRRRVSILSGRAGG